MIGSILKCVATGSVSKTSRTISFAKVSLKNFTRKRISFDFFVKYLIGSQLQAKALAMQYGFRVGRKPQNYLKIVFFEVFVCFR